MRCSFLAFLGDTISLVKKMQKKILNSKITTTTKPEYHIYTAFRGQNVSNI